MSNRLSIKYGDFAPEAKENFEPEINSKENFVQLSQLQKYNLNFPNYENICEEYTVVLDGGAEPFPSVPETANMGIWSNRKSGNDGMFSEPIVLTLTSENMYTSQGLTFTFDVYANIYPLRMEIQWYRNEELLSKQIYEPDSAFYFVENYVDLYNKIVVIFTQLNMPNARLRLRAIDYGYGTIFYGEELRSVNLIQEIDPISSQISINVCDFTFNSKNDMNYTFQKKQPLEIYYNGYLRATTFVTSANRKAKRLWEIKSEDYIGLMEDVPFFGGVYKNKNAVELLQEIFAVAKVPYNIDDGLENELINGHIKYTNCREALMQVAFAIGAVVDTSNSNTVNVYVLDESISQTIPLRRIYQGQSFDYSDTVTSVELVAHIYEETNETVELYGSLDEDVGVVGEEVFVKFSDPVFLLTLEGGTMIDSSANHAHFIVNQGFVLLTAKKYKHIEQKKALKNKFIRGTDIEKIVSINNATLINPLNVDNILEKCYNYSTRTQSTNLDIVEGKTVTGGEIVRYSQAKYGTIKYGQRLPQIVTYDAPVNVGETITAETEYLGDVTGIIIKESFNLNGGIIIKEAVLK